MNYKTIAELFFETTLKDKIFLFIDEESFTYLQIKELCFNFISYVLKNNLIQKDFYVFSASPKVIIVTYLALNYLNKDVNIVSENMKHLLENENCIENTIQIKSDDDFNNFVCKRITEFSRIHKYITSIKERTCSLIQYTSGTTGKPSKIIRTNKSCFIEAMDLVKIWKYDKHSRIACFTPFSYSFAFGNVIMAAIISSSSIITCKKINIQQIIPLLRKNGATHFVTVVSIIKLLLIQQNKEKLNFLKYIICSGSKLSKKDEKKFYKNYKIHISEQYGMTEIGALFYSYISTDYFESAFPSIEYKINEKILYVKRRSSNGIYICTNDFVVENKNKKIKLLGRSDSVLKLDDKRYSVEYITSLFNNEDYLSIAKRLLSNKKIVLYYDKKNKENIKNIIAKLKIEKIIIKLIRVK